jgi:DNA-binding NarL/FixJ family response regulator
MRVFVVDDHPLFRHGLRRVIEAEPDMAVCGEADDAARTLAALDACAPDVAVVDLSLAGRSGLDLVRELKSARPGMPVLMLSMFDEALYAERALRAGASGYVMKQQAAEEVIGAIRRVVAGHVHLSPTVSSEIVRKAVDGPGSGGGGAGEAGHPSPAAGVRQRIRQLSDRELEVFELLGQGLSNRRIAETLYRSVKTIESHRENIKAKLGVRSSAELLRCAIEHSLQVGRDEAAAADARRGRPDGESTGGPTGEHDVDQHGTLGLGGAVRNV